jgi:His-Xaa-Ser repeat protein HxsA
VFVFSDGFWWGLYPWDYYAYGYPYDYYNSYPYSYYDSSYPSDYYDQPSYAGSQQSVANATVSAVQSELAKLGYYNGEIDGTLGDQTEAALARYQEDNDLSVTGIVDAATLQSLGIR